MPKVTLITFNGKTQSLSKWSREIGIGCSTLQNRINIGWDIEKVMTHPLGQKTMRGGKPLKLVAEGGRNCKSCGIDMPYLTPGTAGAYVENSKKYCSVKCAQARPGTVLKGELNPNYSDAGRKVCKACSKEYRSYNKTSKYCSHACYLSTKPKVGPYVKKGRPPKKILEPKPKIIREVVYQKCLMCENTFRKIPSNTQKYCSYKCHLDSGGAFRAGKAAGTMTRKYGAKKDANHKEIVDAFEKLGACVLDMSTLGSGVPDILVMCKGTPYMVDIKNPKTGYGKRGLNQNQKEWAAEWKGGPVYMISTVDQVTDMVNGRLGSIKRFPE
ncbi:hypothetical protein [Nitrosovibrio sp. Nv6]|uniref:hypothetical protein n=1 Tax=Nitrosovibrio sp. Nv6 TaxID=1855340 RepID=UPI0008C27FC9|nr:hypothetical protein [Nitrosovibrio sp. Nv6]SEO78270.1 hypothetical protein SAMN05216316_1085 [Nitrosovibrio sp. Nv6]